MWSTSVTVLDARSNAGQAALRGRRARGRFLLSRSGTPAQWFDRWASVERALRRAIVELCPELPASEDLLLDLATLQAPELARVRQLLGSMPTAITWLNGGAGEDSAVPVKSI